LVDVTINNNNKQAWKTVDGVYLRWVSKWTQWIFADVTEDITSIAWKEASMESATPPTGTMTDFRYGSTCGNNMVGVSSLTITETTCPTAERERHLSVKERQTIVSNAADEISERLLDENKYRDAEEIKNAAEVAVEAIAKTHVIHKDETRRLIEDEVRFRIVEATESEY
jgi:hypothetical protein